MATLREFILAQSTLPSGNLVKDHINNPGSGGGKTIIVNSIYTVAYVGEKPEPIIYKAQKRTKISYVGPEPFSINLLSKKEIKVKYISFPKISMEVSCQL